MLVLHWVYLSILVRIVVSFTLMLLSSQVNKLGIIKKNTVVHYIVTLYIKVMLNNFTYFPYFVKMCYCNFIISNAKHKLEFFTSGQKPPFFE